MAKWQIRLCARNPRTFSFHHGLRSRWPRPRPLYPGLAECAKRLNPPPPSVEGEQGVSDARGQNLPKGSQTGSAHPAGPDHPGPSWTVPARPGAEWPRKARQKNPKKQGVFRKNRLPGRLGASWGRLGADLWPLGAFFGPFFGLLGLIFEIFGFLGRFFALRGRFVG